jgi:fucose permease
MNVQGALVEQHAGRAILPRFHAGYSMATVGSALLGAGLIAVGVPITAHLLTVAVVVSVVVLVAVRAFLPDDDHAAAERTRAAAGDRPGRRLDRRTLLIGVVVLAFAFAEGAGSDWIGVALVDDHDTSAALASLGFAAFLTAMTLGRWTGPKLLNRYGRVATIRGLAALAVIGLLLFVLSPWPALAFAGVVLWGLGACLGYPVAVSAAADDPRLAAHRVSMVSGIGQLAYLGGPVLIGLLGSLWTIQHALVVVPILIAVAVLATGALAPTRADHRTLDPA